MKRWIWIIPLFLILGCNRNKEAGLVYFNERTADRYFRTVKEICEADNGRLWGENIYGPIMFVDVLNRNIYANAPDKNGILKLKDGVYTGVLPKERTIVTNNVEFGGTLYAMVPLPSEEDNYRITSRTIHSLYHCFQERHDLRNIPFNVSHMNDENNRILLKLEWKALIKAISSADDREQAVRDALIFRGARREFYSEGINDENTFECIEGLATFTYIKLCTKTPEEFREKLLEYLSHIYKSHSYTATYGFVHGALYAYLLDAKGFDFSSIKSTDTDLAAETGKLYNIKLPDYCRDVAGSLALGYNLNELQDEESQIQKEVHERSHKIASSFIDKSSTLKINLESPNFSFEPEDVFSLDTIGTLYHKIRVSDNWGRLNADGNGVLISYDLKTMWINASDMTIERTRIYGKDWQVILNEGWRLSEDRNGYSIFRPMP